MRLIILYLFALLIAGCTSVEKRKHTTIFLIGDSTVADYTLEEDYMNRRHPIAGWGQEFQQFFVSDSLKKFRNLVTTAKVVVDNRAKGGRSTRTFFQEGRWRSVFETLQAGDLVLIQFGHNDQSEEKTERYVPVEGYKEFLRLYVSQTREKGAMPILLTPVARNYPWKDNHLENVHGDYPNAMKEIAAEMSVPLIDLNHLSMAHFSKMGHDYVTVKYFMNLDAGIYPAYPNGQRDNTHFQPEGAKAVAQLVFNALQSIARLDYK